jgi:hypothetical protein
LRSKIGGWVMFAPADRWGIGRFAMFQQDGLDMGVSFQEADEFRSTISAMSDNASAHYD